MPVLKIGQLLSANDPLKLVSARTRRLNALQKAFDEAAPAELARASRVKNFNNGILGITADNAATAAKLRHMAPTLAARIAQREPEVLELKIGVQVSGRRQNTRARRVKPELPADALRKFEALAKNLSDGGLKTAVNRLVQHQRRSSRSR